MPFPGNLRELESVLASAVVLDASDVVGLHALPPCLGKAAAAHEARVLREVRKTLATSRPSTTAPPSSTPAATAAPRPGSSVARPPRGHGSAPMLVSRRSL